MLATGDRDAGQVGGVEAPGGARGIRDLVHLDPIHLALRGEEQQPVVGGGGEDVRDDVLLLQRGPADALAAAALPSERVDRDRLT